MNDREWVLDAVEYLEVLLPEIAKFADGKLRDPKTRPKQKREIFSAESYTKQVTDAIDWHRDEENATWARKRHRLFPLREMIAQCLADEFTRWRDIHSLLSHKYTDPLDDIKKKSRMRELRTKQMDMDHMSRKYVCITCQKPVHLYDKNNNQIPKRTKKNTCQCPSGQKLRSDMDGIRSKYRADLERKKALEKATKEKKRRLHGTE